jgi:hypothetical protein
MDDDALVCPHCSRKLEKPEDYDIGDLVDCGGCGKRFREGPQGSKDISGTVLVGQILTFILIVEMGIAVFAGVVSPLQALLPYVCAAIPLIILQLLTFWLVVHLVHKLDK